MSRLSVPSQKILWISRVSSRYARKSIDEIKCARRLPKTIDFQKETETRPKKVRKAKVKMRK